MAYLTEDQVKSTAHLSSRAAARELGVGKTSVNKYRGKYLGKSGPDYLPNAKVLIIDIESKPHQYYSWSPKADWLASSMMIEEGGMICFAAKWLGSDDVSFHRGKNMVQEAHDLLSEADLVITYNGDRYDIKRLNNEFLRAGMAPPKPYRSIDLFKTNKARFDLPYKKLDTLAQTLGVGHKLAHQGFDLWVGCMENDPDAWTTMQEYNIQDVRLTEKVYVKLLPWLTNVPHMGLFNTDGGRCPYCAFDILHAKGETTTFVQVYPLYQCDNCEGWSRGNKPIGPKLDTRRA